MAEQAIPLLVLGGTGRLARGLRAFWPFVLQAGLRPIWQARDGRPGYLDWNILDAPAPPWAGGVILCLAGGRSDAHLNSALALAALTAGAAQGARHVFIASSAAVYPAGEHLSEETSPAPVAAYGMAKAAMEAAALDWQSRNGGAPITLLRIGNVAGADALLGAARNGPVVLDPTPDGMGPRRSYIGPETLSAVIASLAAMAIDGAPLPQILNIATPRPVAMSALLDAAGLAWQFGPHNPAVLPIVGLDTTRLQALIKVPARAGEPRNLADEARRFRERT